MRCPMMHARHRQRQPVLMPPFRRDRSCGAVSAGGRKGGIGLGGNGGSSGHPPYPAAMAGSSHPISPERSSPSGSAGVCTGMDVTTSRSTDVGLRQRKATTDAAVTTTASPGAATASVSAGGGGGGTFRYQRRQNSISSIGFTAAAEPEVSPRPPPPPLPKLQLPEPLSLPAIQYVESYSQPPGDLYGLSAALDLISFMYAVVFYQLVVSSARSLADITDKDRRSDREGRHGVGGLGRTLRVQG